MESFIINDILVGINPTDMFKQSDRMVEEYSFVRSRSTYSIGSKYAKDAVIVTTSFDLGDLEQVKTLSKLITQVDKYPFVFINSARIKAYTSISADPINKFQIFAVEEITLLTDASIQGIAVVELNLRYFNTLPFTPSWTFKTYEKKQGENGKYIISNDALSPAQSKMFKDFFAKDIKDNLEKITGFTAINGDASAVGIYTPFFVHSLTDSELADPSSWEDITYTAPSIDMVKAATTSVKMETAPTSEDQHNTEQRNKPNAKNYVVWKGETYLTSPSDSQHIFVTSIKLSRRNKLASNTLSGWTYPIIQYMGKEPASLTISLEGEEIGYQDGNTVSSAHFTRAMIEQINTNFSERRKTTAHNVIKIRSLFTEMMSCWGFVPAQDITTASSNTNGKESLTIQLIESDTRDIMYNNSYKKSGVKDVKTSLKFMAEIIRQVFKTRYVSPGTRKYQLSAAKEELDASPASPGVFEFISQDDLSVMQLKNKIAEATLSETNNVISLFDAQVERFLRAVDRHVHGNDGLGDQIRDAPGILETAGGLLSGNKTELEEQELRRKKASEANPENMTEDRIKDIDDVLNLRVAEYETTNVARAFDNKILAFYNAILTFSQNGELSCEMAVEANKIKSLIEAREESRTFSGEGIPDMYIGKSLGLTDDSGAPIDSSDYLGTQDPQYINPFFFLAWEMHSSNEEILKHYENINKDLDKTIEDYTSQLSNGMEQLYSKNKESDDGWVKRDERFFRIKEGQLVDVRDISIAESKTNSGLVMNRKKAISTSAGKAAEKTGTPEINKIIDDAARYFNLTEDQRLIMHKVAMVESGKNPNRKSEKSKGRYKGLYQTGTDWEREYARPIMSDIISVTGESSGTDFDPYNPVHSAMAMANSISKLVPRFAANNIKRTRQNKTPIEFTAANMFISHNQGFQGMNEIYDIYYGHSTTRPSVPDDNLLKNLKGRPSGSTLEEKYINGWLVEFGDLDINENPYSQEKEGLPVNKKEEDKSVLGRISSALGKAADYISEAADKSNYLNTPVTIEGEKQDPPETYEDRMKRRIGPKDASQLGKPKGKLEDIVIVPDPSNPNGIIGEGDGDTFAIPQPDLPIGYVNIRMDGIDTDETGYELNGIKFALLSAQHLNKLLTEGNPRVQLERLPGETHDRIIGKLYANGVEVNAQMVKDGYAKAISLTGTEPQYEIYEADARQARRGLWQYDDAFNRIRPENQLGRGQSNEILSPKLRQIDSTKKGVFEDVTNFIEEHLKNDGVDIYKEEDQIPYHIANMTYPFKHGMNMAFPSFKVYMVIGSEMDNLSSVDLLKSNYYEINGIESIKIVTQTEDNPVDVAYMRIANPGSVYTDNHTMYKKYFSVLNVDSIGTADEIAIRLNQMRLSVGSKMHIRAGYGNNINEYETIFNGDISSITGEFMLDVILEGYGKEFVLQKKAMSAPERLGGGSNSSTTGIFGDILTHEEVEHVGRKQGWTAALWANLKDEMSDAESSYSDLNDPESKDLFRNTDSRLNANAINPTDKRRIINRAAVNIFSREIEKIDDYYTEDSLFTLSAKTLVKELAKIQHVDQNRGSPYFMYQTTLWEIIYEMTYRHPGTSVKVVPYEDRSSLFFGIKEQLYVYRDLDIDRMSLFARSRDNPKSNAMYQQVRHKRLKTITGFHIISSDINILQNKMKLNGEFGTKAQVRYFEDDKDFANNNWDYLEVQVDDNLRASEVREFSVTGNGCSEVESAIRYGSEGVRKECEKMYEGSILLVGNPKIRAGDHAYINDSVRGLTGMIKIADAIHHFDSRNGYITEIVPALYVECKEFRYSNLFLKLGAISAIICDKIRNNSFEANYKNDSFTNTISLIATIGRNKAYDDRTGKLVSRESDLGVKKGSLLSTLANLDQDIGVTGSVIGSATLLGIAGYGGIQIMRVLSGRISPMDFLRKFEASKVAWNFIVDASKGVARFGGALSDIVISGATARKGLAADRAARLLAATGEDYPKVNAVLRGAIKTFGSMRAAFSYIVRLGPIRVIAGLAIANPISIGILIAGDLLFSTFLAKIEEIKRTREPLKMYPLLMNGAPYIGGVSGYYEGSWWESKKQNWKSTIGVSGLAIEVFNRNFGIESLDVAAGAARSWTSGLIQ